MDIGENNFIYNSHNPNSNQDDWNKKYRWLEIYSNNFNPFLGPSIDFRERRNRNYFWGLSSCFSDDSNDGSDRKETQGDKLIYYEGNFGSITITPLTSHYKFSRFVRPLSVRLKEATGTFKLKIEPTTNLSDDVGEINQLEFLGAKFFSADKFLKTFSEIIQKKQLVSLNFNEKGTRSGYHIKRGKTGNKLLLSPYDLKGEFEDYSWLEVEDNSNALEERKKNIQKLLEYCKLNETDLKNPNWKTDLNRCDNEEKQEVFLLKLEQEIKKGKNLTSNDNGFSFSTKLIIGAVISLILMIGLLVYKKKSSSK